MKTTFTKQEVRQLLKNQVSACRNRFGRFHKSADDMKVSKTIATTKLVI